MTSSNKWSARRPILVGLVALLLVAGGLGYWSYSVQISGAVIASGTIEVQGDRKTVQHPDGGVVGEILVEDGDSVSAGDVIIRLDGTLLQSALAVVEGQLFEVMARQARFAAERDGAMEITFPEELLKAAGRPDVSETMEGQRRLFLARRNTLEGRKALLSERVRQIDSQVEGTNAQIASLSKQHDLIGKELADYERLFNNGLATQARLLSLRREEARLEGQLGELNSRVAQLRGVAAEIEIERLNLDSDLREIAISELRDLEFQAVELRERVLSTSERLSRLEVRAPVDGIIHDSRINTIGAVISKGDVLLYVVPRGLELVINSRIPANSIDEVSLGQTATLRFTAFNMRNTPEVEGIVTRVSADAFVDKTTNASYYSAEIMPTEDEVSGLEGLTLVPGMPVEAFIMTGARTPLSFLVKPLADYFERAFREV